MQHTNEFGIDVILAVPNDIVPQTTFILAGVDIFASVMVKET